ARSQRRTVTRSRSRSQQPQPQRAVFRGLGSAGLPDLPERQPSRTPDGAGVWRLPPGLERATAAIRTPCQWLSSRHLGWQLQEPSACHDYYAEPPLQPGRELGLAELAANSDGHHPIGMWIILGNAGDICGAAAAHLVVCALTRLAPGLCFTVCYAAILAKTNRIARIFQVSASSSKRTKFTQPDLAAVASSAPWWWPELLILAVGLVVVDTPSRRVCASRTRSGARVQRGSSRAHLSTGHLLPQSCCCCWPPSNAFKIRKVPDGFNEKPHAGLLRQLRNCTVDHPHSRHTGVVICYGMQLSATAVLLGLFLPRIYIRDRAAGEEHEGGHHVPGKAPSPRRCQHGGPDDPSISATLSACLQRLRPFEDDRDNGGRQLRAARIRTQAARRRKQTVQQQSGCDCRVHRNASFTDAGTSTSMQLHRQQSPAAVDVGRDKKENKADNGLEADGVKYFFESPESPQWDCAQFTTTV
uniref:G_PROTEIN_RECEP_F3_4 domain-containing protein n=1 Tax=Macrostomum lignano TaxID=282301 RepID=A0A1I8JRD4_9PLAT